MYRCARPEAVPRGVRPLYEEGGRLGAEDLLAEQGYRRQRLRRHNRLLHGWGVVCGLGVVPENDPEHPWTVRVCPGYAIGPWGDEIVVPCSVRVDIAEGLWQAASPDPRYALIGVRYAEVSKRMVPVEPAACRCPPPILKPSRIRDCFQVDVLWAITPLHRIRRVDLCRPGPVPCPPCPDSPYVLLARVKLPDDPAQQVALD